VLKVFLGHALTRYRGSVAFAGEGAVEAAVEAPRLLRVRAARRRRKAQGWSR
jgi:hypothetical protein